ncbi:MAG TPA: CDP-alcohol phosphatidyltransferase family protein [Nannocystaceae bacterium]|nr:CDP-alcohol phosphatidyltransferase family protein [Nannocystaceae bacterium]
MVRSPIQQAVLLATATTTSTRPGRDVPLALVRCGGITLLKRALLSLSRKGVRRFVIVIADAAVRRSVVHDAQLRGLEIIWVRNVERPDDTTHALWRARPHLRGEFFVVPVDRVFAPQVLDRLLAEPLDGATLAVSRAGVAQSTGALPPALLASAGLGLQIAQRDRVAALVPAQPDATALGVFSASRILFDVLDERTGDGAAVEIGEAFARLAARGQLRAADVEDAWWHPVRSPVECKQAERVLVRSLRKSVDGVISRHVNRRFSLAATRLLMNTAVRPNHVTAFSLFVSIMAAVVAAMATALEPGWFVLGAVLWQLASMLDGIDGELARLKFQGSRLGEWFDTLTDDVGRFVYFIGAGIGLAAMTGQTIWLQISVVGVVLQLSVALNLYRKLIKTGSGSHYALAWETKPKDTWTSRLYHRIEFMSRRDYYVFVWMVLAMVDLAQVGLVIMVATTAVVFTHETLRPRQAREDFMLQPPTG